MMLQDFDVTKKTLNVTFKKMLQKKILNVTTKKMLQKKIIMLQKKIKHVTRKNTVGTTTYV